MDKFTKIKIELMMDGISISKEANDYLLTNFGEKFYNDDYVTTSGVMLQISEDVFATAHMDSNSPHKLVLQNGVPSILYNNEYINVQLWKPCDYMVNPKLNKNGLLTNYVNVHFDRARISPIIGCDNNCAFCSWSDNEYEKSSLVLMDEGLVESLKDERVTHVLISGGSPHKEDLEFMTNVYEYFCKKFPNYDFDVMMTPRGFNSYHDVEQYEDYIKHLKEIGVKGLSINLELFSDEISAKYCKEKFLIGKEKYFIFLKLASKIFGTENVRSGLIVGLESKEDTLNAVEEICKCGCMPMLSPYIPYNGIGDYPSSEFLIEVYEKTEEILNKYNIPMAPLCKKCKHNTL